MGGSTGGKSRWTQAHWRWLETVKFDQPVQQIVSQEYVDAVKRGATAGGRTGDADAQGADRVVARSGGFER